MAIPKKHIPKFDKKLYYFDEAAAIRVVKFIENYCTHVQGSLARQKIKLMTWQKIDIIYPIFGVKKKENGFRKHTVCWIEIPKKNGKSTILAALTLYMLCADGELGAEIFGAAAAEDQARIIFGFARDMIKQNPFLKSRLKVMRNSIQHIKSNSVYRAVSSTVNTKHGPNLHSVLFDEMHAQPNDKLWSTLHKGTSSRDQPITWVITNSGYLNSFAHTMHDRAVKIQSGQFNEPSWHVVIYGANPDPKKDDIHDPKVWAKVNPNYTAALKRSMESDAREVRQLPSTEPEFKRLRLGIWVGNINAWIAANIVKKCQKKFNNDDLLGRVAYGGFDAAYVNDLCSYSLIFPPLGDKPTKKDPFYWLCFSWLPEQKLYQRMNDDNTNFRLWHKQGFIKTVPGDAMEYGPMMEFILELHTKYEIRGSGYDPWKAWGVVSLMLQEGIPMQKYRQGPTTMGRVVDFMELNMLKGHVQFNNPCLSWQMSNVRIKTDSNGNKWMDKDKSKEKIDGPVSACNALCEYLSTFEEKPPEIPEDYEFEFINING